MGRQVLSKEAHMLQTDVSTEKEEEQVRLLEKGVVLDMLEDVDEKKEQAKNNWFRG